ncbi:MAG: LTA synthase family protein [Desulfuromonas sp.]|nr:LTA synthase family protein [Desulfuromonas sp.]
MFVYCVLVGGNVWADSCTDKGIIMDKFSTIKTRLSVLQRQLVSPEALFVGKMYLLMMVLFAAQRLFLLMHNFHLAENLSLVTILQAFWVGARFDLAIASYLLVPLLLALIVCPRLRQFLPAVLGLILGIIIFAGLAEAEFYREFESRYNGLVLEYISHPLTVGGMLWDGYPVIRYLLYWAAIMAVCMFVLRGFLRPLLIAPLGWIAVRDKLGRTIGNTVLLVLMVFALRGGFNHEPLRWGDAFFSQNPFANHLALNGLFTLGRTGWDKIYSKQKVWAQAMPAPQALELTRNLVVDQPEALIQPQQYPLLRATGDNSLNLKVTANGKPVNVVVILLESFAGRMVGALGSSAGITPEFDEIAEHGVLFERAFSNGTHTHQGVYASLTSFPNVPGYEYLMKMMEANQEMSSLPELLKKRHYQSIFLYNGEFSWDNKEGFFRQHGMERFIGLDQYQNPYYRDPVWGVSDLDVFRRANEEFRQLATQGPFFATILTLSNHSPFNLPDPLPFTRLAAPAGQEGRYNAMRFADWSLGEFFRLAKQEDYFANTLFVLTGDHGFASAPMVTGMNLSRFNVPLLFYAPELLDPQRRSTIASQVDIEPTILGLLGPGIVHQSWGRNLFAVDKDDAGYAIIKPSGGEERVAYIADDYLLELAPKEKPRLYKYQLGAQPQSSDDLYATDKPRAESMKKSLQGYIETAILALRARTIGVAE